MPHKKLASAEKASLNLIRDETTNGNNIFNTNENFISTKNNNHIGGYVDKDTENIIEDEW